MEPAVVAAADPAVAGGDGEQSKNAQKKAAKLAAAAAKKAEKQAAKGTTSAPAAAGGGKKKGGDGDANAVGGGEAEKVVRPDDVEGLSAKIIDQLIVSLSKNGISASESQISNLRKSTKEDLLPLLVGLRNTSYTKGFSCHLPPSGPGVQCKP